MIKTALVLVVLQLNKQEQSFIYSFTSRHNINMQAKRPSTHHKNDWEPTFNTYPSVTLSSVPPYKCEFSNLTPLCGVNIMHLLSDPLASWIKNLTNELEELFGIQTRMTKEQRRGVGV